MQVALVQSPATVHPLPFAHFFAGAQMPPQSTSVSVWFLALSEHVGAWHTLVVQTLLVQSVPVAHARPFAQPAHMFPPQSVSVSAAFFTVSLQVGARQVPPVQTPLVQSADTMHALPSTHFFVGAQTPPQS